MSVIDGFAASLHNVIILPYIVRHGTEEQKKHWLPKLAKGEAIEKLFDRQLWHMSLGETAIPVTSPATMMIPDKIFPDRTRFEERRIFQASLKGR